MKSGGKSAAAVSDGIMINALISRLWAHVLFIAKRNLGGREQGAKQMAWYWHLLLFAILMSAYFYSIGQPRFWKLTRKYPQAALIFFEMLRFLNLHA